MTGNKLHIFERMEAFGWEHAGRSMQAGACIWKHADWSYLLSKNDDIQFFFNLHVMVNKGLFICFIIFLWIIYYSKGGSVQTGACRQEHAHMSMPTGWCDQKSEGEKLFDLLSNNL